MDMIVYAAPEFAGGLRFAVGIVAGRTLAAFADVDDAHFYANARARMYGGTVHILPSAEIPTRCECTANGYPCECGTAGEGC